jgi:hypothetical protein
MRVNRDCGEACHCEERAESGVNSKAMVDVLLIGSYRRAGEGTRAIAAIRLFSRYSRLRYPGQWRLPRANQHPGYLHLVGASLSHCPLVLCLADSPLLLCPADRAKTRPHLPVVGVLGKRHALQTKTCCNRCNIKCHCDRCRDAIGHEALSLDVRALVDAKERGLGNFCGLVL